MLLLLLATYGSVVAVPAPHQTNKDAALLTRPATVLSPCLYLAGDSTTQTGSGWGACFIQHLAAGAHGINDGVRGTTTATYRARGNWDSLLKQVKDAQGSCMPFVTISFGHNDEKALSEEQYRANLGRMFDDASAAGAKVLFVSPLSRRVFSNGRVVRDLARWADDMASVASQKGATCLNLNQASADLLDQEGASVAASYNLAAGDYTHLNAAGCQVFGQLVAQLAHDHVPDLAALVKP